MVLLLPADIYVSRTLIESTLASFIKIKYIKNNTKYQEICNFIMLPHRDRGTGSLSHLNNYRVVSIHKG